MKFKTVYRNPYQIEHNFFITLYKYVSTKSETLIGVLFRRLIGLLFKRLAFDFVKKGVKLYTRATLDQNHTFSARSTNSQFHSIYFSEYADCYEPDVFGAIINMLPENGTIVDVGANWGHHSFFAAMEKNATVFSFEPNPTVYRDLADIRVDLKLENSVHIYNCGLSSADTNFTLTQIGFESGVGSVSESFVTDRLLLKNWLSKILEKPIKHIVHCKTLDKILINEKKRIDLIKLDCEGVELEVLRGATKTIIKDRPNIVFELHTDENADNYKCFKDFFFDLNYSLFIINADISDNSWTLSKIDRLNTNAHYNLFAMSN